jgi:hypothetical protein
MQRVVDKSWDLVFYVGYAHTRGKASFMYDANLYYKCELNRSIWQEYMITKANCADNSTAAAASAVALASAASATVFASLADSDKNAAVVTQNGEA